MKKDVKHSFVFASILCFDRLNIQEDLIFSNLHPLGREAK